METLAGFVKTYVDELKTLIGQIPSEDWRFFPDFFYQPYLIRARICSNGVAILFKRPANHESITVKHSEKRAEEVFLPYLPPPKYYAVFAWTNATRVWHVGNNLINWDWAIDPKKGKKFQGIGEDFRRMSVMHLNKSTEVQMLNCRLSGVNDYGRANFLIRFLWMMTEDCVELDEEKAKWYAHDDFSRYLDHILFASEPAKLPTGAKEFLLAMLKKLQKQFEELISRSDADEPEVQDFLENHKSILDLNAKRVLPKQKLGKENQADFILAYDDGIRVVEIKKPFDPEFNEKLQSSSVAVLALSELARYEEWLKLNKLTAQERYHSDVIKKGWAIIGSTKYLNGEKITELDNYNSKSETSTIRVYDELLENFRLRIDQIKAL